MEENTDLRAEVSRLNQIISVLLDLITTLKQENDSFRTKSIKYADKTASVSSETANILNNFSFVRSVEGKNLKDLSSVTLNDGQNLRDISFVTPNDGRNIKDLSPVTPNEGQNLKDLSPVTPNNGRNPEDLSSVRSENMLLSDEIPALIAPAQIEISSLNTKKLGNRLKIYFPSVTKQPELFPRIASELLFMHNNGVATTKELRKLIGLSESGFAKHFPKLKKKNFVYKQAPWKFALTQLSKDLINEVFGVAP